MVSCYGQLDILCSPAGSSPLQPVKSTLFLNQITYTLVIGIKLYNIASLSIHYNVSDKLKNIVRAKYF
jgi:hypothetical protein